MAQSKAEIKAVLRTLVVGDRVAIRINEGAYDFVDSLRRNRSKSVDFSDRDWEHLWKWGGLRVVEITITIVQADIIPFLIEQPKTIITNVEKVETVT